MKFIIIFISVSISLIYAQEKQPNIILIIVDDLGYGELERQDDGRIPTPHIDSLAQDGVKFTNAYVTGPYCSASRAAIMTGRYQNRFGYENPTGYWNEDPRIGVPNSEWTIAEQLQRSGYTTSLIGKWHLGATAKFHPMHQGFDEFFGFMHEGHYFVPEPYEGVTTLLRKKVLPGLVKGRWTSKDGKLIYHDILGDEPDYNTNNPIVRSSQPVDVKEYLTDVFTTEAIDFMKRTSDRPFFLTLSYNAVHSPLQGLDEYMDRFTHIGDVQRRIFAAMLANLDDNIGRVLNYLKSAKIEEETLIYFLSDNGGPTKELTSSNGVLSGSKGMLREGGIRVPFIMRWNRNLPAGKVYHKPIISTDIFATSAAVSGVKVTHKAKRDGVNLIPYLTGENQKKPHKVLYWKSVGQVALRSGDWKLLKSRSLKDRTKITPFMLFNLKDDIGETEDLSEKYPEKVQELLKIWQEIDKEMAPSLW